MGSEPVAARSSAGIFIRAIQQAIDLVVGSLPAIEARDAIVRILAALLLTAKVGRHEDLARLCEVQVGLWESTPKENEEDERDRPH